MEVSLNYCSQNGGNLYRAPYYNRNLNIGPRIVSNLGQSTYKGFLTPNSKELNGKDHEHEMDSGIIDGVCRDWGSANWGVLC